jgi:hypothetical protein
MGCVLQSWWYDDGAHYIRFGRLDSGYSHHAIDQCVKQDGSACWRFFQINHTDLGISMANYAENMKDVGIAPIKSITFI